MGGTALVAYAEAAQYSRAYQFGSALLNQCFVLLPILGVAPFFLGRLLDLPRPDLPESRAFPPGWFAQAAVAATIGIVIAGSFLLEIFGFGEIGAWTRAAAIVIYLATKMPFRGRSFLADCLRAGIIWIAIGVTVAAFLPVYRVGALHIVFITGLTLVAFTVAIRVVFGHSGQMDLLQKPLRFFIAANVLLFLAMISRFTADLAPGTRILHLLSAATCWLVAAFIWMVKVIPNVAVAEPEE
jgi:hypothetical protein